MTGPDHSPDAERLGLLDAEMRKHDFRQDALIEVLNAARKLFGHLAPGVLLHVARRLKLPPSRVHGVATFYHLFSLKPAGEHACVVCNGTACYVKGADALVAAVAREAGVRPGRTTPDGRLTLATTRCVGTCGLAPLAFVDGAVVGHATPEGLAERAKGWLHRGG